MNNITRDSTNGDRINVKAGTDEILAAALSFTTYGTPTGTAPLIIQGYTSAAGDGGQGSISCGDGAFGIVTAVTHTYWKDMAFHSSTSAFLFSTASAGINHFDRCEFHDGVNLMLVQGSCRIVNCNFHDWGTTANYAITANSNGTIFVYGCHFKGGGAGARGIGIGRAGSVVERNAISGCGLQAIGTGVASSIVGNSILASGDTGTGVSVNSSIVAEMVVINNIVEGYSGVGGQGFDIDGELSIYGGNAAYNNTTNYAVSGDAHITVADNESLGSTLFAKSGSDTFANRAAYFAPLDVGNVWGGAYPTELGLDKGAVQHAASGGGGVANRGIMTGGAL